ncbi:MAG TPA: phage integrase SAM-like domain-containing protein [Bacteroidia bacterium]|jgi:site-specific recombinase XerD
MHFYFELKKINDKEGTIRGILSERGVKAIISTGQKIVINQWKEGKPKAGSKNDNIKLYLNKYQSAFEKYMTNVKLANDIASLSEAKDFITANVNTINVERGKKDLTALLEQFKGERAGFLKEGALKPFTTLINHLQDFNPSTQFADMNPKWAEKFAKFLSTKSKHVKGSKNLQNPTINKMIVTLKVFCRWAFDNKHTSATDWMKIKRVKETDQRIITLHQNELFQYFHFDFKDKTNLERAKDVFCFATFLGLRYNDLMQVNKHNIKNGYLHINTHKTNTELRIKLIPEAVQILAKYNNVLPLDISNQKLNKNIKAGVKLCGIDREETIIIQHLNNQTQEQKPVHELISIHDARKSFISISLEGGLSISEVMQMSTHSDYRSFSRYVNLEQSKVDEKLVNVFSNMKIA